MIETIDPLGHISRDERDALDQVVVHTDPMGNTREYSYDNA
ncbi:hypothetical protein LP420_39955 [Massilia sp. B-10]|nr:hypothetical protein LP420_39955 [Massilia sp. B-10]